MQTSRDQFLPLIHNDEYRVTCHAADGEAVLLQLGVRVRPLQDDSLLRVSLRHRLSPQPHRPQCREVSDSTVQRPWEKFDIKFQ